VDDLLGSFRWYDALCLSIKSISKNETTKFLKWEKFILGLLGSLRGLAMRTIGKVIPLRPCSFCNNSLQTRSPSAVNLKVVLGRKSINHVSWGSLSAVEYELGNLPSLTEMPYKYLPLVDIAHSAPFQLYVRRCNRLWLDNLENITQIPSLVELVIQSTDSEWFCRRDKVFGMQSLCQPCC
jgi:hypothetical protein